MGGCVTTVLVPCNYIRLWILCTRTSGMNLILDGWFHERGELWPGQALSLQGMEVLPHGRSDYPDSLVFSSTNHGTIPVLDGVRTLIIHPRRMLHPTNARPHTPRLPPQLHQKSSSSAEASSVKSPNIRV